MKKYLYIAITVCIILIGYAGLQYYSTVDLGEKKVSIEIKPGDSLNKVISQLLEQKVLTSSLMLKINGRLFGLDKKLTPGYYEFSGENSCRSVFQKLESADFIKIKVTIPEGNTIWETAALLASKLDLDSTAIHQLNRDTVFLNSLKLKGLEGFLFPETYYFKYGLDEKQIVTEIYQMYQSQTDSVWAQRGSYRLEPYELLTLASIIEAETGMKDERKMVSSVYTNRLNRNMKLDADPTVIYGLGGLDRPLYRIDLRKETPYNTYLKKGLPPTPINSPGLASIIASFSPAQSEFLYFVADDSGGHVFSKTLREHNRAIQRIKANRK